MDKALFPEGVERCDIKRFGGWMTFCLVLGAWALLSVALCLLKGLNQTGMNDYFAFGVWIVVDLAVIALGAGAFFTGFLTYILKQNELKNIINHAVIIGFICYSGAILMLGIDIGQPIRGWFGFWHANIHSMLTEVMFCITTYLVVLIVEFVPLILEQKQVNRVAGPHFFAHNLHTIMIVFAAVGTFLSFFHQGSLGGMFGVLYGRSFAFRAGFLIWPWTFFLFIWSSIAAGPCFTMLVAFVVEKVSGRKLVPQKTFNLLGKISGWLLATYFVAKVADTIYWTLVTVPASGHRVWDYFKDPFYGLWLLFIELILGTLVPAVMLLLPKVRSRRGLFVLAACLACLGVTANRFIFVIQTLAVPELPFERFIRYFATWQEWGIVAGIIAYGFIVYSLAYRYLPVFPKEVELNAPK
ncbi:MAG: polysulfide reductase NrfD [Proteobacteria bacterium]|nr:polysulfide reductase NrfD [Pseudomonadota bacterium]